MFVKLLDKILRGVSFVSFTRLNHYLLLLAVYLASLIIACSLSSLKGSIFFVIFCLLTFFSVTSGICILMAWEKRMKRTVFHLLEAQLEKQGKNPCVEKELQMELEEKEKTIRELNAFLEKRLEEMRQNYLEFEDLRQEHEHLKEECDRRTEKANKDLAHKTLLIQEYQFTISEQRSIIEKKQRKCETLETKVQTLVSEIQELLQIEKNASSSRAHTSKASALSDAILPHELSLILRRYVDKVEDLTGVQHIGQLEGKSPRFLDLSFESFAVDKRGLSDSFSEEEPQIIFIYSRIEKKFLFVNRYVKILLGHGPEKFMKEFPSIVSSGFADWKIALGKVGALKEVPFHLVVKNKLEKNVSLECLISPLSKGPFAHHVLGIMKPN